jgi:hypothetical protein
MWRSILLAILALTVLASLYSTGCHRTSGVPSRENYAVISGLVKSTDGEPLKKAHVTLVNLSTEEKTETQTNDRGSFVFTRLYPGKYKLEVKSERGETASDEVTVGRGKTASPELVVK